MTEFDRKRPELETGCAPGAPAVNSTLGSTLEAFRECIVCIVLARAREEVESPERAECAVCGLDPCEGNDGTAKP